MPSARKLSPFIAASVLALACSGGASSHDGDAGSSAATGDGGARDDAARVVPEDLTVTALAGGNGVLELTALTLRAGPGGLELYAALKNVGDVPACHAALSVELFDRAEQSVAAGINGLLTERFYRRTDGSETVAACIGPGDVSMSAVTLFPADVRVEDVGLEELRVDEQVRRVSSVSGPFGGHLSALAADLLRQVRAGQPIARRDAVRLARGVLESDAVRAAEALLEADDGHLIARVTDLALALFLSPELDDKAGAL